MKWDETGRIICLALLYYTCECTAVIYSPPRIYTLLLPYIVLVGQLIIPTGHFPNQTLPPPPDCTPVTVTRLPYISAVHLGLSIAQAP